MIVNLKEDYNKNFYLLHYYIIHYIYFHQNLKNCLISYLMVELFDLYIVDLPEIFIV